ncbi:hypothetical protein KY285_013964 [Solanum tuberosum]|nr:hypothetical protein KY285_013964 [Solanum tuberosum]
MAVIPLLKALELLQLLMLVVISSFSELSLIKGMRLRSLPDASDFYKWEFPFFWKSPPPPSPSPPPPSPPPALPAPHTPLVGQTPPNML